jgi:transcriptional regulator with XRE-family HTH domain
MNPKNGLGRLIKQKRQELMLTQRALAKRLGVEASHVAYLEGGKRKPSLTLMARLEEALGVSRQQIFLLSHPEAAAVVNPADAMPPPAQRPANEWRQFMGDRAFVKRHRINARELRAFKELALLGYVLSRHQVLAILTMIREPQDG